MEFCERCGGMILVKNDKATCVSCGHKQKKKPHIKAAEKITQQETVAVIKEEQGNRNALNAGTKKHISGRCKLGRATSRKLSSISARRASILGENTGNEKKD